MSDSDKFVLTAESLHQALPKMGMATQTVHADDFFSAHRAIAPGMQVAVNYRYTRDPDKLVPGENLDPNAPFDSHVYSRYTAPNSSRFETVLQTVFGTKVMSYSSGLAAFHAAMVLLNPKRVFIGKGYHGVHGVLGVISKLSELEKLSLEEIDKMGPGDVLHIETPLNPTGEARNLAYYGERARAVGAYMTVDSTFGPPPLQDPLHFGADLVLHSGTKYIGGHSDMLCGILVIHPDRVKEGWVDTLYSERQVIGSMMGSLEGWLGIRSLRTLHLRVTRQADTAEKLASWLHQECQDRSSVVGRVVDKVQHASLQEEALKEGWLQKQMPRGYGPVFSMLLKEPDQARRLPSRLYVFQHATSLGDVESLVEWRSMSDDTADRRLIRVSCGIEDFEDLRADLLQGFEGLLSEARSTE